MSKSKCDFSVIEGGRCSVYELSLEEMYDLLQAMHGLRLVEVDCSPEQSNYDRCNEVWKKIAKERGLDWKSIYPAPSGEPEFFSARKLS